MSSERHSDPQQPISVKAELVKDEAAANKEMEHASPDALDKRDEPPVVARLVIEIRSDGRRTIARGAAEDVLLGEKVAVHAEGTTPLALALSLAKSLVTLPALAKTTFKAMLPGRKQK
ncbi:MAG: hypothetical protein ABI175_21325 [Polyangiales bacterium]